MLTELHIQNFVLIDEAALAVSQGLTALTGETGAGKSILLDALGLAVGGRAERGVLRQGAAQGSVSASFDVGSDHPAWTLIEENGLSAEDDHIILRRVIASDGKSRGFVNDQPVSIALLRSIGETLLEIHGQHDGRGFLTASTHRALLDEFAGAIGDVELVSGTWRAWRKASDALVERRAGRERAAAEADYLRHVVAELDELDPQEAEEGALADRRAELMAAERVTEDLAAAVAVLAEDGLEGKLVSSAKRLVRAAAQFPADENPLSAAIDRLDAALSEVLEARAAVEDAAARLGADPAELERVETRLFALRAAARKHGVAPDGLAAFREKAATALSDLERGEAGLEALEAEVAALERRYFADADTLSAKRAAAAKLLDGAVAKELAPLKLGRAAFSTRIDVNRDRPTSEGIDQVEFMVATNPGAPAGPLKTIASGGELSRFVLAMKAALAAKENRTVIIFDEVDAGVGGAVADAVGERLARLARDAQVLVVTHSPQVAARAAAQWLIEKVQKATTTTTRVALLSPDARVEEIARMLSGARVTEEARAAARRLLGAGANVIARPRARKKTA